MLYLCNRNQKQNDFKTTEEKTITEVKVKGLERLVKDFSTQIFICSLF